MINSDLLMIGVVFLLLVGSVSLYLYMYVQQVDQKVSLLEGILLDLKVSHEITSFDSHVLPASEFEQVKPYTSYHAQNNHESKHESELEVQELDSELKPFQPELETVSEELKPFQPEDVEELSDLPMPQPRHMSMPIHEPVQNYETMSLKELQAYAKSKGVSVGTMKKTQLIETLKGLEQSGFQNSVVGSSFLETSAPVSNDF